jgi:hypothetical protein
MTYLSFEFLRLNFFSPFEKGGVRAPPFFKGRGFKMVEEVRRNRGNLVGLNAVKPNSFGGWMRGLNEMSFGV